MPISDDEWTAGTVDPADDDPETEPVGEYDTERDLILAFLDENADEAFTREEMPLGVDFDRAAAPDTVRDGLNDASAHGRAFGQLGDAVVDVVGEVVASSFVLGDVTETLDQLVREGAVLEKDIDGDGESVPHYRLNTDAVDVYSRRAPGLVTAPLAAEPNAWPYFASTPVS